MRLHLRFLIVLIFALATLGTGIRAQENQTRAAGGIVLEGRAVVPAALAPLSGRRTPIVAAVERVRGAVVNIHSERTVHGPARRLLHPRSLAKPRQRQWAPAS